MVEQVFGALFVLTLATPAMAVVVGIVLLAWPRRGQTRQAGVSHGVSAHA